MPSMFEKSHRTGAKKSMSPTRSPAVMAWVVWMSGGFEIAIAGDVRMTCSSGSHSLRLRDQARRMWCTIVPEWMIDTCSKSSCVCGLIASARRGFVGTGQVKLVIAVRCT